VAIVGGLLGFFAAGTSGAEQGDCDSTFFPDFTCDDREARPAGHIEPMSMPYLFEDPYITTGVNFVGIYHNFPTDGPTQGGHIGVMALQARLAITDRLAFIATKDGFAVYRPDTQLLNDAEGFLNITGGFKYAVIDDREKGLIVTPAIRFEIPVGNEDVYQGHGDGIFIPSVSAGYGPGSMKIISGLGFQVPFDTHKNLSSMFYNIHLNHPFEIDFIPGSDFIVPFMDLNGLTYINSGDGDTDIDVNRGKVGVNSLKLSAVQNAIYPAITADRRWEGADVINFGSQGMAGETLITMAWGVRVPFNNGVSAGFSYERVLSQRKDIFEQRATWMLSYTF
jgi:hypothetical protein